MQQYNDKVIFANQLRALAIIAVMIVHLCGIFWLARETVSTYIYSPVIEGPTPPLYGWLSPRTVNYGPFGVAVFFLISGFVIPFSLSKSSPVEFLISRALRIYPTYLIGSVLAITAVWLSSLYWGKTFSINFKELFLNLTLTHSNLNTRTIDLVNWTLAIEIKFYIISALLFSALRKASVMPILLLAIGVLGFTEFYPTAKSIIALKYVNFSVESLKAELMIVCFMFVGTLFHFHFIRKISTLQLVIYSTALLSLVLMCWTHNEWAPGMPNTPLNYFYGLGVFTLAYTLRKYFRPIAPLDFIAKISYPLYIIHSLISYSIMRVMLDNNASFYVALATAVLTVIGIAYLLHITIENASINYAKTLIKRMRKVEPAIPDTQLQSRSTL